MKPIAVEVVEETPCSKADIDGFSWKTALSLVGAKNPDTGNEYRKWLDMEPGARLDRVTFARFAVMFFYCQAGRGRHFSKRMFLSIEADADRLTEVIKRYKIHERIRQQNLQQIGDFSRYGLPPTGG
ncbi:MAG: hypothetical protein RBJ76_03220 [Stenomitos frigidus ULC029]